MSSSTCYSLRFPQEFNVALLLQDMKLCTAQEWNTHFNTADYSGNWTSIALYSASGNATDILTFGEHFRPTPLLDRCGYFSSVIDSFQCPKESVRLLNLAAGSVIHEHRDRGLCYAEGVFRIHIPLQTNPDVDFIVDGQRMEMQAGECWYADFDRPHAVKNRSTEARVHLVIDCIRNEWSDELFRAAGYDFSAEKKGPDQSTILRMIEELERMNNPASGKLIAELKAQLHDH